MKNFNNALFYGDCLVNLQQYIETETVDLVYLDPPFNSDANYNRPFRSRDRGKSARAPAIAFHDMWHWDEAAKLTYQRLMESQNEEIVDAVYGLHRILKQKPMMAYILYMTERLIALHRVLKPTGNIYIHCDPTASHYLKVIMDAIFSGDNFRNELVWYYDNRLSRKASQFSRLHDIILLYGKTGDAKHNLIYDENWQPSPTQERRLAKGYEFRKGALIIYNEQKFAQSGIDESEYPRVYRSEASQPPLGDVWSIPILNPMAKERLGYPTQKPLALLERVINASSNEGDLILDPFCGCGTTLHAAHKLNRRWFGMDISYGAINVIKERLQDAFSDENLKPGKDFTIYNAPTSYEEAVKLADIEAEEVKQVVEKNKSRRRKKHQARYDFQNFILGQIRDSENRLLLQPSQSLSRDGGIDGWGTLFLGIDEQGKEKEGLILVQVKTSKKIGRREIDEFYGVMKAEEANMGIFISLHGHRHSDYEDVLTSEAKARVTLLQERTFIHPLDKKAWPEFQFWSVSDLMENRQPQLPMYAKSEVPKAVREAENTQLELEVAEQKRGF